LKSVVPKEALKNSNVLGTTIKVTSALYGRTAALAQHIAARGMTSCAYTHTGPDCALTQADQRFFRFFTESCDNKKECEIKQDVKKFPKDPCPAETKYFKIEYICKETRDQYILTQFVKKARKGTESGSHIPLALDGPPDVFPNYWRGGDKVKVWRENSDTSYITLEFETVVRPTAITLYETYNAGCITMIKVKREGTSDYKELWVAEGGAMRVQHARAFRPTLNEQGTFYKLGLETFNKRRSDEGELPEVLNQGNFQKCNGGNPFWLKGTCEPQATNLNNMPGDTQFYGDKKTVFSEMRVYPRKD